MQQDSKSKRQFVELEQLNNEMKQISAQQQIASRNSEGAWVWRRRFFEDDDSEAINDLTIQLNGENQNSEMHASRRDPCFGKVTHGWSVVERMHQSTGALEEEDWKEMETPVKIVSAVILR